MDSSAWIALVALVVAVVALLLPLWRERNASLTVVIDEVWLRSSGGDRKEYWLVIHNAGPAAAKDVTIESLAATDGQAVERSVLINGLVVELVHAGQDFYMQMFFSLADPHPTSAVLSWKSGRRRTERRMLISQRPII